MGLAYRLSDYERYAQAVGEATYVDISRRTDPARITALWGNLRELVRTYGAPWVVQLWTKNVQGALAAGRPDLEALVERGCTVTAQLTVTGLAGSEWEPLVPPDSMEHAEDLARLIGGPEHLAWRYDPIIPTVHSVERFAALARRAADQGIHRGVINFIAPPGRYKRVDRRLGELLPGWAEGMPEYDDTWRWRVATELVTAAAEYGISLACCAESAGLAHMVPGLRPAACGDYAWFVELSGRSPRREPYRGSRPGCGCLRYFDVGNYGYWGQCHRCAYCYAG